MIRINPVHRIAHRMQPPRHLYKRYKQKKKAVKTTFARVLTQCIE